ncbi:MAG: hypothetical protein RLZZ226_2142 [Pseudomonadota bacterium]
MSEMDAPIRAGFIGLGAMGLPMAQRLARHRCLTHVWNRTGTIAAQLAQDCGITAAVTPAELAAHVEQILICVSRDADVLTVVDAILPALKPGTVVIDFSTIGCSTAALIGERIRQRGGDFLDIPVSGGVEGARTGQLVMMAGGCSATLARVRPLLDHLGTRLVHFGDNGQGQAAKAVNQVMAAGINQAVTEALALGARAGLDMDPLIDLLAGGAAGNWFLQKRGKTMIQGQYPPGFKLALHHKDLTLCETLATALDITIPLASQTRQDYQRLMDRGFADEDISALYRLKQPTENP